MPELQQTEIAFLLELHRATKGDASVQKSMFETGAAIGLAKEQAGKVAEEVIGRGWAEVKTLSGGIGITTEGIEAALFHGGTPANVDGVKIGGGPFLDDPGRQAVEAILAAIKTAMATQKSDYDRLEEIVIDIKTIEVQLLSPRPRTGVIKAVLRALQNTLSKSGAKEIGDRIGRMIA